MPAPTPLTVCALLARLALVAGLAATFGASAAQVDVGGVKLEDRMIEITWSLLGFALLLLYLAWRERVATNHRDARLLAGAATIAGLAGAAGAVVGVL